MFESSGLVGNAFGLSTPTPLYDQFNQPRPGQPLFNTTIGTVLDQWIADPTAPQFTDQNNEPWYSKIELWTINQVTSMNGLFKNRTTFNDSGITGWNLINVVDMESMFEGATAFNQDISAWNVSNATTMANMFKNATSFNQNINAWNITSAVTLKSMFEGATAFNENITNWNLSSVSTIESMFEGATVFNQNISGWNVSNLTSTVSTFKNATSFNHNIVTWNVSNVTNMTSMFEGATSFNHDISKWNVLNVMVMNQMFKGATAFNQALQYMFLTNTLNAPSLTNMFESSGMVGNSHGLTTPTPLKAQFSQIRPGEALTNVTIGQAATAWVNNPADGQFTNQNNIPYYDVIPNWNITQVTDMSNVFSNKPTFNSDITGWDVRHVLNMSSMFKGATSFNQDIGVWDVDNVTNMESMFEDATAFNQFVDFWQPSKVTNMIQMFKNATAFNKPIQYWPLIATAGVPTFTNMLENSGLVGNTDGLTTPTPLKSEFNKIRPGEPLTNGNIDGLVADWIADPTAPKFTSRRNNPFFDVISEWDVSTVSDMNSLFKGYTTFNNDITAWRCFKCFGYGFYV